VARKSDFEVGASILGLGVVLTVGSYMFAGLSGGGMYLVCYGPIFYGILRMGRGLARREPYRSEARLTSGDLGSGAARRDQVVGHACAECGRKIIMVTDGARCKTCDVPFHNGDCLQKHTAAQNCVP
jgi:hypothetical protein